MTYAAETRWHWFSLDSSVDLSGLVLELTTDAGVTWTVGQHTTAPVTAAAYQPPDAGQDRYWWRALFGPALDLKLTSMEQVVAGRITVGTEQLMPTWTVYSEAPVPDDCWPLDTECLGETWDAYPADVQHRAGLLAVETLRMLTGYRVGACPVTVRPCARACAGVVPTATTYPVAGHGHGTGWWPALSSGVWLNTGCTCATGDCSCTPLSVIRFPSGIGGIVEVMVDGAVLAPSAYRVEAGLRLVRIDGARWPVCQNMAADTSEDNTFAVTYIPGVVPGVLGAIAAGRLAGEYAKSCMGATCALPARTKSLTRAGVSIQLASEDGDLFPGGLTGIREVDTFIKRHNPHALKGPSAVWYPGMVTR